jgi:hypothetical protein
MSESKNLLRPVYEEHLNSIFKLPVSETETIDLELVRINGMDAPPGYESFSLVFRAPHSMPAAQGLYSLRHEKMDASDLFLVPIERNQDGVYFEAVFNRILE